MAGNASEDCLSTRRLIAVAVALIALLGAYAATHSMQCSADAALRVALVQRAQSAAVDAADMLRADHIKLIGDARAISAAPDLARILPFFSLSTLRDSLDTETWAEPYRKRFPLLGVLWPGDRVVRGATLDDDTAASIFSRAKSQPFSALQLVQGVPYLLAAAPVSVHPDGTPPDNRVTAVVLVGKPLDQATLDLAALREDGTLVIAQGKRSLVEAGDSSVRPTTNQLLDQASTQAHDPNWRWTAAEQSVAPGISLWVAVDTRSAANAALGPVQTETRVLWALAALVALAALALGFRRSRDATQPPLALDSTSIAHDAAPSPPLDQTHVSQPRVLLTQAPAGAAPIPLNVAAPVTGQVFGRYVLVDRLGAGGMGEVYLAVVLGAEGFRRNFVVKRLKHGLAADATLVAHFIDEARLGSKLVHANIVPVFDFGKVGDEYFMAQEYIDGRDLERLTSASVGREGRALPVHLVLYAAHQVLQALAYAHTKTDDNGAPLGLVHRDVSPQNVLVSSRGEVRLFDFGIVKSADKSVQTEAGVVKGNVSYMSPEQARGANVDARSDLFSLGLTLFRCLTGEMLYRDPTGYVLLMHAGTGPTDADWARIDALPAPVPALLRRALAINPEQRFQNAQEFAAALPPPSQASALELAGLVSAFFGDDLRAERDKLGTVGSAGGVAAGRAS